MTRGYILLTTLVLTALLASLAVGFLERRAQDARLQAQERDAALALHLAENALAEVHARFLRGDDLDGDGHPDRQQRGDLGTTPPRTPAPYIYPPAQLAGVPRPTLLQALADRRAGGDLQAAQDPWSLLDRPGHAPLAFVPDADLIPRPAAQPWRRLTGGDHALVWMELVPDGEGHRLYLQSAAQVGQSRRYLQRLLGRYDNRLGRRLGAITEANPGVQPP